MRLSRPDPPRRNRTHISNEGKGGRLVTKRFKTAMLRGAVTLGGAFGLAVCLLATGSDGTPVSASGGSCQSSGPTTGAYTATVCLTDPADGATIAGNTTIAATASFTGTSPGVRRFV